MQNTGQSFFFKKQVIVSGAPTGSSPYTDISISTTDVLIDNDHRSGRYGHDIGLVPISTTKTVISWVAGTSSPFTAKMKVINHTNGLVSSTSGSEYNADTNIGVIGQACVLESGSAVSLAFRDNAASGRTYVNSATVSGNTLSNINSQEMSTQGAQLPSDLIYLEENLVAGITGQGGASTKYAYVLNQPSSGTGTDVNLSLDASDASLSDSSLSLVKLNTSNKMLAFWPNRVSTTFNDRIKAEVLDYTSTPTLSGNTTYTYTLSTSEDNFLTMGAVHLGNDWCLVGWVSSDDDKLRLLPVSASSTDVVTFHTSQKYTSTNTVGADGYRSSIQMAYITDDPSTGEKCFVVDAGVDFMLLYKWDTTLNSGSVTIEKTGFTDTDDYSSNVMAVDPGNSDYFMMAWLDESTDYLYATQCQLIT